MSAQEKKLIDYILLYSVIISHHVYIILFIASVPVMIIKAPWYISVPLISWFLNASIGQGWICPWTTFENKLRKKVGYPQIDAFVKHYYVKPYIRYKIRSRIRSAKKDSA
ncbi:MAG: DUF2784 family protein [Chloroflexota bacterium]|nr:DUF2784 family protein [Chloroflexota bacterium]|tara:strand:+ start:1913 stop:2242 length:330 start_codon:yes stop_codon:yes gene_type:complete